MGHVAHMQPASAIGGLSRFEVSTMRGDNDTKSVSLAEYVSDRVFDGVRPVRSERLALLRGFFAGLTAEQQAQALHYTGEDSPLRW